MVVDGVVIRDMVGVNGELREAMVEVKEDMVGVNGEVMEVMVGEWEVVMVVMEVMEDMVELKVVSEGGWVEGVAQWEEWEWEVVK